MGAYLGRSRRIVDRSHSLLLDSGWATSRLRCLLRYGGHFFSFITRQSVIPSLRDHKDRIRTDSLNSSAALFTEFKSARSIWMKIASWPVWDLSSWMAVAVRAASRERM